MIQISERVEFLKKIHLFYGVKEEQLFTIAEALGEEKYSSETDLSSQVGAGKNLLIIYEGSLRVTREKASKLLAPGDHFGEEQLLTTRPLRATVTSAPDTTLLVLARQTLRGLFKQIPRLKYILEADIQSLRLARARHFDWLTEDETIYFLARKHWVNLVESLFWPSLGFILAFFILSWGVTTRSSLAAYAGGILIWPILAWAGWQALDWSNDYYIVTSKRVVWLEKVIGLYDSREEAPLTTLLSVSVETDLIGRLLDYGTVVVRTFVGRIQFKRVIHPFEASHLISEHWERTKQITSKTEKAAMHSILREKIGLAAPVKPQEAPKPEVIGPPARSVAFSIGKVLGGNLFKIRFEDSGTITYRKHWYVLFKQIWQPTFFLLIVFIWMSVHFSSLLRTQSVLHQTLDGRTMPDTLLFTMLLVMFLISLWWIYQFWDWSNDIFQVTSDQILDIDKKPFGTEERRAAQLENILSTQYSRIGLAGYIFNFGTVYITVGGSQLAFEDVQDPASVQADIDRRREKRDSERKEAQAKRERERIADWFAAYHENIEDLEHEQETGEEENAPEMNGDKQG